MGQKLFLTSNFCLLTSIFCFLFSISTHAQKIKGGAIAGLNATQVDGDNIGGYNKFGWNAGAIAIVPVSKIFFASMEILYSEKGSRSVPNEDNPGKSYKLVLNYAEVPVLFNYDDKNKVNFGAGISIGTLIKFKEYRDGVQQIYLDQNLHDSIPYRKRDYSGIINGNFWINNHWVANLRYSYSFRSNRSWYDPNTRITHGQYHNDVAIRLMYFF